MTQIHKFTIRAPLNVRDTVIEIDGRPLNGVCRVSLDINSSKQRQILYLQIVGDVVIEGEFKDDDIITLRRATAWQS